MSVSFKTSKREKLFGKYVKFAPANNLTYFSYVAKLFNKLPKNFRCLQNFQNRFRLWLLRLCLIPVKAPQSSNRFSKLNVS